MKKVLFFFAMLFVSTLLISAQDVQVRGVVTYADDGSPIIGASVMIQGTSQGTLTDMDGKYQLSIPQ